MQQIFKSFSHEFGTSLNYTLALAQVAEEHEKIEKEVQSQFFKPIAESCKEIGSVVVGKKMHAIISDMIDFNQILGKSFNLQLAPMKVRI